MYSSPPAAGVAPVTVCRGCGSGWDVTVELVVLGMTWGFAVRSWLTVTFHRLGCHGGADPAGPDLVFCRPRRVDCDISPAEMSRWSQSCRTRPGVLPSAAG